ncbi:MAG TPA: molecular chaperone HtpG [Micromonosporaceae bacterium]
MTADIETLEFQAEARQLLQLVIHSVYSNKDVFLRELISNASDALDKLRMAAYLDKDLQADVSNLHIEVSVDPAQRLLTVRDNGIGMSREEVVGLIGTIARSGTAELLQRMRQAKDAAASPELIGQFGVGFYASFMVADKVVLTTRRAGEEQATRWESDGHSTYTIETVAGAAPGTSVTLHLKPADDEDHLFDYTAEWKLREIVKRYSDFIPWPITMDVERSDSEGKTTREVETLNSMKALWARSKDEVSDEEYHEFYRHISHDWTDPLEVIQMKAEGTFEYEALLFLPARAPFDLFHPDAKRGVQLYVKRVFIMDDCQSLMPAYLRFVKGVVDAHDLSLNVSREILQQDRQIQIIRRRLVKKVLATVKTMMDERPDRYRTFWDQFGRAVKEGLLMDPDNREAILDICSFASTHDPAEPTTLRGYLDRMKDGQQHIYFMTGPSRTMIENSPHLEAFRDKGLEVLLLTDPVDEVWVDAVHEFSGKALQSIAKGEVDLDSDNEKQGTEAEREQRRRDFADLLAWMATLLEQEVKEVRLSSRLTTSPACIVADQGDLTPALARMYRAMGQDLPASKRILELNPKHPLVLGLRESHRQQPDNDGLVATVQLLFGAAVLAEGGELADPARFARVLTSQLERGLPG